MSKDIENILRQMPLVRPSDAMDERILRRAWKVSPRTIVVIAAAAAIAALIISLAALHGGNPAGPCPQIASRPTPASPNLSGQPSDDTGPIYVEQDLSRLSYQGLFTTGDNTPVRMFRRQTVRQTTVIDASGRQEVQETAPDTQIILVQADTY